MHKKTKPNFTFRVIKNGKTIDKCRTHSKRRFYNRIRTIKWKDGVEKVYLMVSYGKDLDNFGKMTTFYNDGWYKNKRDLFLALSAFSEVDGGPEASLASSTTSPTGRAL